jgi:uncharacterized protein YycO
MGKEGVVVPRFEVRRYGPGETVDRPSPGDFLLTHGNSGSSGLIRLGQRMRYQGSSAKFAHWSHAALFVDENGMIVEAMEPGVQERDVRVYRDTEYHVVHLTDASAEDRNHAVAFAMHCLNDHYGILTDISLFFTLLTGTKIFFGVDGQMICSGLVARALERTGAIFQYDSWHLLPADLAEAFNVTPTPGASKGTIPPPHLAVIRRSH